MFQIREEPESEPAPRQVKRTTTPRKPKVELVKLERIFLNKMFTAYKKQYIKKNPTSFEMCVELEKKLAKMGLIEKDLIEEVKKKDE
ncbi:MAG: hypothetical protein ACTSQ8_07805 [Candidatus Helarchaeota archaeon]